MRPNGNYIQVSQELAMTSGTPRPTYDDVKLILKLYDMRREARMREARKWFGSYFKAKTFEEFNALCPPGSEPNASYRMLTSYWEMVASFITNGVLHQELFFEGNREFLFVWERVRDVVPELRKAFGNPIELKHLELISEAYIQWWRAQAPAAYEAFSKRVRG
jgi:hypothetical protein